MTNYPQELAQDAVCLSHTGHMTELWFLPTRPLRLNTNECMDSTCFGHYCADHQEFAILLLNCHIGRFVLGLLCGGGWVRLDWSSIRAASACETNTTQNQPHQISNTQRTENKTTDVVIQQHSRKLLMMSETC